MKVKRRFLGVGVAVLVLTFILAGLYVSDYYHADEVAQQALLGSETVTVTQEKNMVVFTPKQVSAGFIFYPGGKVETTAYAPLMLELAERNILCVILEMPCHLAVLDMDAAEGVPKQFTEVERWYLGGHSLGGSMAASYVGANAKAYEGLVLLAAYSTEDLNTSELAVISLYGSQDGVLNMEKYQQYRGNLPDDTHETVIEGGNHANFGSYGAQEGDGEATISPEEQIEVTAQLLTRFFRKE